MRDQFLLNSQLRLSDLETLTALRDHGSVRAIARLFHATPGSISKALKRIETTVGQTLCERTPGAIRLTPAGVQLVERIQPLLLALRPTAGEAKPTLTFAAPSFLIELVLDSLVPLAADVQWRTFELSPALIASHLQGRLFSLALTTDDRELQMPWVRTRVGSLPIELYANPTLAASLGKTPVAPSALMTHDFVTPVYKVNDRLIVGDDGCPIPVQQRRVGFEVQSVHAGLLIASQLDLLVYSPRSAAKRFVEAGKLVAVAVKGWHTKQSVHLWTHADLIDASTQKLILQTMRAAMAE